MLAEGSHVPTRATSVTSIERLATLLTIQAGQQSPMKLAGFQ